MFAPDNSSPPECISLRVLQRGHMTHTHTHRRNKAFIVLFKAQIKLNELERSSKQANTHTHIYTHTLWISQIHTHYDTTSHTSHPCGVVCFCVCVSQHRWYHWPLWVSDMQAAAHWWCHTQAQRGSSTKIIRCKGESARTNIFIINIQDNKWYDRIIFLCQ